jgi:cysteinyl-tRNA synthetase
VRITSTVLDADVRPDATGTMPAMNVYNTIARAHVPFVPTDPERVTIYVCGPTVQSEPHLGHGRSAVAFDVLWRYLEWKGYGVVFVRNVTDIDDKIIAKANELGVSTDEVARSGYEAFTRGYDALGNRRPTYEPKATENIAQMVTIIETLIAKGNAYESEGDVYFSVRSFNDYGKLSRHDLDDLRAGDRVEAGDQKHDALDFALWKAAKPGEPFWESPWGQGRPGWHIECSAMAEAYLGNGFDVHGGGTDLIFPHHENELTQSEAASGETFARYWMHNGMLNLSGEKMAKSTGHLITLLESLEQWDPMAIRLFYLRTHYRKPLDFNSDAIDDAEASLDRLRSFDRRAEHVEAVDSDGEIIEAFTARMDDDLDVAGALAVVFDTVRAANGGLDAGDDVAAQVAAFREMLGVLGLSLEKVKTVEAVDVSDLALELGVEATSVEDLLEHRVNARSERNFALADAIRDGLATRGITLEDTADGTRWHRD